MFYIKIYKILDSLCFIVFSSQLWVGWILKMILQLKHYIIEASGIT